MRLLAIVGLGLYGLANLFAGAYVAAEGSLPVGVDAALLVTGALFVVAVVLAVRRSAFAFRVAVLALLLASALAVFNERVLGLGHPSHHIVRGLYTLVVFGAVLKGLRQTPSGGAGLS